MTLKSRGLTALAAIVAVAGLVLTGCSGGSAGSSNGEGELAADQSLTFAPGLFPVSLDIANFPAEEGVQLAVQQTLQTLVTFDGEEATPLLAESWDYVTPTELTFALRDDVTFSDGTPFTAEDVKASLQRYIDAEKAFSVLLAAITEIRVDDEHTVTLVTSEPVGTLVGTMSLIWIGKADAINDEAYWKAPVGTGPFVVDEYVADDHISFSRNEEYWGEQPALTSMEFVNIPETAAQITALETGEVDVVGSIPPDQVSNVKSLSDVSFDQVDSLSYYFIWFNQNREPFADVRVRQAMVHALNIGQTVPDLFGESATVAGAPVPQTVFGATKQKQLEYDPDRAKELLAEAGYPDGFTASMQWPTAGGPNIQPMAKAFISDWAKVGIKIEPLEKERAQWLQDFGSLNWDLNLQTNATPTGDADYTLNRLYTCAAERMGYCNPALDATLARARASLDQDERAKLYEQANEILWTDVPGIWPVDLRANIAYRDTVTGLELPSSNRPDFSGVVITE
ncbi:ABC transporter substrate-binding protein [Microbacterium sp. OR16]|uniref:ABC transporter substrate-binding protein n=1 Tax=Microbacterium sp. OR16 TaxID=3095345 RepID=UPI0039B36D97